jgi:hypothetical protein
VPPTFILILAGIIVFSLAVLTVDVVTRPRRRRKIEGDRSAEYAAENAPIPGLAEVIVEEGWRGPLADPVLTPGLPFAGILPANHPLAGGVARDQPLANAQPVSPSPYAANLTVRLHSALSPHKWMKGRFRGMDTESVSQPDYLPVPRPRLVHCYRADVGGVPVVVGNCYLTLDVGDVGTGYRGPMPDLGYIGSAFCAVSLSTAVAGRVQVVPKEKSLFGVGLKSGFAELDNRYSTVAQSPKRSRSKVLQRMQQLLPDEPDPLGPALAAFIAGRNDWAFTVDRGLLVCATLQPLQSGEDARLLVANAVRAARLIGE